MTDARRNPQKRARAKATLTKGHGAKPAVVRERAILALLSEPTIGAAARRSGVNECTLRRWLTDDEAFQAEYEAARTAMYDAGMSRIQALTADAVATLAALMGRDTPPNVRLGAARTVVELAIHERDAGTILRRLADLEAGQRE